MLHHVCNIHVWYGGECEHDTLPTNIHGVQMDYFVRGSADYILLQKILLDKTWIKSLKYFTCFRCSQLYVSLHLRIPGVCLFRHTGNLENFF